MSKIRHHLPLLHVLKTLKPYQRQIIIDHLDDDSCDSLTYCLSTVVKQVDKLKSKKKLQGCVKANKKQFCKILSPAKTKKLRQGKKRALTQVGGNPLGLILSTAIPLLLSLI